MQKSTKLQRRFSLQGRTAKQTTNLVGNNENQSDLPEDRKATLLSAYSFLIMEHCRHLQSALLQYRSQSEREKSQVGKVHKKDNWHVCKLGMAIKVLKMHNELNRNFFSFYKQNLKTILAGEEVIVAKNAKHKEIAVLLKEVCLKSKEMSHDIIELSQEIVKSYKLFYDGLLQDDKDTSKKKINIISKAKELAKVMRRRSSSRHEKQLSSESILRKSDGLVDEGSHLNIMAAECEKESEQDDIDSTGINLLPETNTSGRSNRPMHENHLGDGTSEENAVKPSPSKRSTLEVTKLHSRSSSQAKLENYNSYAHADAQSHSSIVQLQYRDTTFQDSQYSEIEEKHDQQADISQSLTGDTSKLNMQYREQKHVGSEQEGNSRTQELRSAKEKSSEIIANKNIKDISNDDTNICAPEPFADNNHCYQNYSKAENNSTNFPDQNRNYPDNSSFRTLRSAENVNKINRSDPRHTILRTEKGKHESESRLMQMSAGASMLLNSNPYTSRDSLYPAYNKRERPLLYGYLADKLDHNVDGAACQPLSGIPSDFECRNAHIQLNDKSSFRKLQVVNIKEKSNTTSWQDEQECTVDASHFPETETMQDSAEDTTYTTDKQKLQKEAERIRRQFYSEPDLNTKWSTTDFAMQAEPSRPQYKNTTSSIFVQNRNVDATQMDITESEMVTELGEDTEHSITRISDFEKDDVYYISTASEVGNSVFGYTESFQIRKENSDGLNEAQNHRLHVCLPRNTQALIPATTEKIQAWQENESLKQKTPGKFLRIPKTNSKTNQERSQETLADPSSSTELKPNHKAQWFSEKSEPKKLLGKNEHLETVLAENKADATPNISYTMKVKPPEFQETSSISSPSFKQHNNFSDTQLAIGEEMQHERISRLITLKTGHRILETDL